MMAHWTTPDMLAPALPGRGDHHRTRYRVSAAGLITLTINEFRRLFDAQLLTTRHTITSLLA